MSVTSSGVCPTAVNGTAEAYQKLTAQSTKWDSFLQLASRWSGFQSLSPTDLFRGLAFRDFTWDHSGLSSHLGLVKGEGNGVFGTTLITQPGQNPDSILVDIESDQTHPHFDGSYLEKLQSLFPGNHIELNVDGNKVALRIFTNPAVETSYFREVARSFVNTLVNDPNGALGARPIPGSTRYVIPEGMFANLAVVENPEFFGNFGEIRYRFWSQEYIIVEGGRLPSFVRPATIKMNIAKNELLFYPRVFFHHEAAPDLSPAAVLIKESDDNLKMIRRIALTLVTRSQSTLNLLDDPIVSIGYLQHGMTVRIPINARCVQFLTVLITMQNNELDVPLVGLTDDKLKYLTSWFNRNLKQNWATAGATKSYTLEQLLPIDKQ